MNLEAFLANLSASHLLADEELARVRSECDPAHSSITPTAQAQRLVEQKLLTRWQAQMLLSNRVAFRLGKYRLTDLLGRGGMGAVFKAEHATRRRIVAIKVMSEKFVNDTAAVARFRREIQAAAALNHPNIVLAIDADCTDRTHFLVMEYVAGEDLESVVKRLGSLPLGTACEYVRQAAAGLQHAHERGMAHRDIKPANLLLAAADGGKPATIKILDMGLARLTTSGDEAGLTHTGQVMGTPDYIAPEQAMDTKTADIRSDIFSLGCTLFRLASGKLPFPGNSVMEKLMSRAAGDTPRLQSVLPGTPDELDAIVARMMARDPAQRFQTPRDVLEALAPFATLNPSLAALGDGIPGTGAPRTAAVLSNPSAAPPAAVAANSLPPVSVDSELARLFEQLATEMNEDQSPGSLPASQASGSATSTSTKGVAAGGKRLQARIEQHDRASSRQRILFAAVALTCTLAALGFWQWNRAGETQLVIEWPEAERGNGELEIDGRAVRKFATGELKFPGRPGRRSVRVVREGYLPLEESWTLGRGESRMFQPQWQPTSETLRSQKYRELKAEVDAAAASNSPAKTTQSLSARIRKFRLESPTSPESLELAGLAGQLIWPADALRREDIPPAELRAAGNGATEHASKSLVAVFGDSRWTHGSRVASLTFSPDNRWLISGGDDRAIRFWDTETGYVTRTLVGSEAQVSSLSCVGTGTALDSIALVSTARASTFWDLQSTSPRGDPVQLLGAADRFAASPNGKTWAFGFYPDANGNAIVLVDAERREELHRLEGHTQVVSGLAFRGDSRVLASSSTDGTVRLWDVPTGKSLHVLKPGDMAVAEVSFPGTGTMLASGGNDGVIRIWDSETGQQIKTLVADGNPVHDVAFSHNANTLAACYGFGGLVLWDVAAAQPRRTHAPSAAGITTVAFSRDGTLLAAGDHLGGIRLYDGQTGEERIQTTGDRSGIQFVSASPDGGSLVALSFFHGQFWNLAGNKEAGVLPASIAPDYSADFHPDGETLMIKGRGAPPKLFAWPSRTFLKELPSDGDCFAAIFSPNGDLIAAAQGVERKVRLQDSRTGALLREMIASEVQMFRLAFSPDSRTIAAGGGGTEILLWEVETGKELRRLEVPDNTFGLRFSPDGKLLCVFSPSNLLLLFNVKTGRKMPLLSNSDYAVSSAEFSPDGRSLAAVCTDGTIRFWDMQSGDLIEQLESSIPNTPFPLQNVLTYTPDGRHLAVGTRNGTVHMLRLKERPGRVTVAE